MSQPCPRLALLLLALPVACSGGEAARTGPDQVVRSFLTAADAHDEAGVRTHLTSAAGERLGTADGFSFTSTPADSFTVGEPTVDGDVARVPTTIAANGTTQEFEVLLRVEEDAWRVHGLEVAFGGRSMTLSFEGDSPGEALVESVAEEIAEGMSTAFEEALADWQNGGSAEDLARDRARFAALAPVADESVWRVDVEATGRRAQDVLTELLEETGYALDAGEHTTVLATTLETSWHGISRVRAVEEIAAALGLVPVYGAANPWEDAPPKIGFEAGPRRAPVAFVGPYLIEAAVRENPPHTTGTLTVTVRALGLDPGLVAANDDSGEVVALAHVVAPDGRELRRDPDTSFWGSPVAGERFEYSVDVGLRGLVASVESLGFEGQARLVVPTEVETAVFEGQGTQVVGPWSVTCDSFDEHSRFTVTAAGREVDFVRVRFAPELADGTPLGILMQGSTPWDRKVVADVNLPAAPSRIVLKVCETQELLLPFRVERVALARFAEQPAELEPLAFRGSQPIEVGFERFGDRSNPDFPEVVLEIASHANKHVEDLDVTFEYLDVAGRVVKDFPHSLTGEYTLEGTQPLVRAGETGGQTATAFFMPSETDSVRVRVDRVSFVDGTRWERE